MRPRGRRPSSPPAELPRQAQPRGALRVRSAGRQLPAAVCTRSGRCVSRRPVPLRASLPSRPRRRPRRLPRLQRRRGLCRRPQRLRQPQTLRRLSRLRQPQRLLRPLRLQCRRGLRRFPRSRRPPSLQSRPSRRRRHLSRWRCRPPPRRRRRLSRARPSRCDQRREHPHRRRRALRSLSGASRGRRSRSGRLWMSQPPSRLESPALCCSASATACSPGGARSA